MSETFESSEDHVIKPKKPFTNTQRINRALDAIELLPLTDAGDGAAEAIVEELDRLHRVPLTEIEHVFKRIRIIFLTLNQKIDI